MASVLGVIGNSFLRRKNFLHKQIISKIQKCMKIEMSNAAKQFNGLDLSNGIPETMTQLLDANDPSQDLCFRVRNEMINKCVVPEQAVDTRILDICVKTKKFQIAKAYVNCLQSKGYAINIYALARYLQLYQTEKPVSSYEENEIINIFERIQKECEHIPPPILKSCIMALCQTHKWHLTVDLIKDYTDNNEIMNAVTFYIIPTAFRNGEISIGLRLLNKMDNPDNNCHRSFNMYKEYLDYYLLNEPTELNTAIEQIFCFWRKYDIVPTKYIIDLFVDTYNNAGWEAKYVTIKQNGYCRCCGNDLSAKVVCDTAFKKLANNIIAKALVNTDIFQNTTPLELNKFKTFIYKTKPYDIVIDGLNVTRGTRDSRWLKQVVDYFSKDNNKILIIARKHLYPVTKWVKPMNNVYIYFLENITNDDPFILYATLISGSNAKFVTLDLLRQHVHKLENRKVKRKFKRWQYTHQYRCHYNCELNKIDISKPWLYEPFAQCNNGYWHIPYRMNSEEFKLLYQPVDTWICFRSPQK